MAIQILNESYDRKYPLIEAMVDSTSDMLVLGTQFAEGSRVIVRGDPQTVYKLDAFSGWKLASDIAYPPLAITITGDADSGFSADKTYSDILQAIGRRPIQCSYVFGSGLLHQYKYFSLSASAGTSFQDQAFVFTRLNSADMQIEEFTIPRSGSISFATISLSNP